MLQSASLPSCHTSLEWKRLIRSSVQEYPTQPCPGAGKAGGAWATLCFQAAKAKEELSLSGDISLSCVSCRTQQAPSVGTVSALQVREIRKGWKDSGRS